MNVTPYPAATALRPILEPELQPDVEIAQPDANAPQLVLDHLPDARSLLHHDQRLLAKLVETDRAAGERVIRGAGQYDLVPEERLEDNATVAACGSHDTKLELASRHLVDDGLRVGDG